MEDESAGESRGCNMVNEPDDSRGVSATHAASSKHQR